MIPASDKCHYLNKAILFHHYRLKHHHSCIISDDIWSIYILSFFLVTCSFIYKGYYIFFKIFYFSMLLNILWETMLDSYRRLYIYFIIKSCSFQCWIINTIIVAIVVISIVLILCWELLRVFKERILFNLQNKLIGRCCYCPHYMDVKTKAQGGCMLCSKSCHIKLGSCSIWNWNQDVWLCSPNW